jgi:hypothetical protein
MIAALAGTGVTQSITLDHVDGLYAPDTIPVGQEITFYVRLTGDADNHSGITNGFRIYSPDGAQWGTTVGDTLPLGWPQMFSLVYSIASFSIDGQAADTVGFGGSYNPLNSVGLPAGFNSVSYTVTIGPIDPQYHGKTIVLDSSYYPPIGRWKWGGPDVFPSWDGPHVYTIYDPNAAPPPTLTLSPTELNFTAPEIGPNPSEQSFDVSTAAGENINFTVSENAGWLHLSYGTLTTPATIQASVNYAGLAPGTYVDSIAIASPDAENSPIYERVTFEVVSVPRYVVVDPTQIADTVLFAHSSPGPHDVSVTEVNGFTVPWQAEHNQSWVHIITDSTGMTPGSFTIQADTAGLAPGDYVDTVYVRWQPDPMDGSSASTVVRLTILPNHPPVITYISDWTIPEGGSLTFYPHATDADGDPLELWLVPLADNMTAYDMGNGNLMFRFKPDYTQAGDYPLTFYATDGIDTSSQQFTIHVEDVQPVHVITDPAELNFTMTYGQADSPPATVLITEQNGYPVTWEAGHAESWVHLFDSTGTAPDSFQVRVSAVGLTPGDYQDTIHIDWQPLPPGGDNAFTVVNLTVLPNHPPQLFEIGDFSITECDTISAIFHATDPDGDPLELYVTPLAPNMQFDDHGNGDGTFTFTPDLSQAGDYSLTAYATDGVDTVSQQFNIHVADCQPNIQETAIYDPSTFHTFDANIIRPVPGYVRFGNFGGNYTAADVDLSSVRVLDGAIPDDISVVASYPGFIGQVVQCQYDVRDFVRRQVPFYDTSYLEVMVTGQLTDGQSFEIIDSVRFIGHLRGDLNLDGSVDISDVINMVDYFFADGPAPADLGVADLNKDGTIDISDLMVLIEKTF